jgi:hypothetical protein
MNAAGDADADLDVIVVGAGAYQYLGAAVGQAPSAAPPTRG